MNMLLTFMSLFVCSIVIIFLLRRSNWFYGKRGNSIFLVYLAILFIATGMYYLLPPFPTAYTENMRNTPSLYDTVFENDLETIPSTFIDEQWEFTFEQQRLQMDVVPQQSDPLLTAIERKKENDGEVEVIYYTTPLIIEGMEITDYTPSLDIELTEQALQLKLANPVELQFRAFQNEFAIAQFTEQDYWMNAAIIRPEQLLYVRIPKGMEIEIDTYSLDVHYLEEEK